MNKLLTLCTTLLVLACISLPSPSEAGDLDRVAIGHEVKVLTGEDVAGDVVVIGADADVDGRVRGDVVVIGGRLTLGPNATVDGDAVHVLGALHQADAAKVAGSTVGVDGNVDAAARILEKAESPRRTTGIGEHSTALKVGRVVGWAASSVCLVVLGLLFLSTWPERSRNLRRTVEASPGASLLVGGLVTAGLFLLLILLGLTIVGFLAWPLILLATSVVWLVGLTGVCEALGDRLPLPESMRGRAGSLVAGALAFSLLGLLWMAGGPATALAGLGLLMVGSASVGAAVLSGLGGHPFGR
ncbi:MAG: polymer-forming cytoskeletal protein [Deltaproteobacteria bacterium]|nr:polymer-forming cytoskeletal protein [Deltaproteobacteria bacterium]